MLIMLIMLIIFWRGAKTPRNINIVNITGVLSTFWTPEPKTLKTLLTLPVGELYFEPKYYKTRGFGSFF